MKITIAGAGYVGLVTGTCLAEMGNDVLCLDIDAAKIRTLNEGGLTIFEPGLKELVAKNVAAGRLGFTTDTPRAVDHGTLQFIAVGTPPGEGGSAELQYVLTAARSIGRHMTEYKVVVNKSTAPVGTADKVQAAIKEELAARGATVPFAVVSNPEFLKQGAAVQDFMRPDRVVIGAEDERAIRLMRTLYAPYIRNHDRLLVMDMRSAELTKYAANAMLATRISFMNDLAVLAEHVGADIESVRVGIGSDSRIGYSFLYAGCGYGGSCFPKDVKALIETAKTFEHRLAILDAVEGINTRQKRMLASKIFQRFGANLQGRRFAMWGLAFKPNTDDLREAASRQVIAELLDAGATVCAFDPVAMNEARKLYKDEHRVTFAASPMDACKDAGALIIVTEWQQFRSPDFEAIRKSLLSPVIFDGRNLYDPRFLRESGFEYFSIGRT
jgi:UDPglucose 6-dehydrogenase